MAHRQDLPCDADEVCMVCHTIPPDEHVLLCDACGSPWHMQCLTTPLHAAPSGDWSCPDCSFLSDGGSFSVPNNENELVGIVKAIEEDSQLSSEEKARKRQQVLFNDGKVDLTVVDDAKCNASLKSKKLRDILDENLMCIICMQLADRPVTTPCGHNFCLKCFERWVAQSKRNCAKCRSPIPPKMISQPRINATLVMAIRMARLAVFSKKCRAPPKPHTQIVNESRPDKAFTTDRAVCKGKSNACSGRIFVTVPPDHFGPILAKDDPIRHQGVIVGETWEDRLECRQWGVHLPHVAGIAGQSDYGAQSVALSGGYDDDEDHGEWFLYTGSGGRDLSGNKRTAKDQSFDQTFDKYNEALRMSCKKGYPVRVVRSHKEKSSSYAPEKGVRYDGIYRIEKCWRKKGIQGFKVCRYLFVRCDNEPAPWTSDEIGDRPRPLPIIKELKYAIDITERKGAPAWNWKASESAWCWVCDPPESRRIRSERKIIKTKDITRKIVSMRDKLKREFACNLCKGTLNLPVTTPCGHNFCSACLDVAFAGQEDMRHRFGVNGRMLRTQKVVKACPSCKGDIADFLINPQVNRQLEEVIQSLMQQIEAPEGNPDGAMADHDSSGGNESNSDKENKYYDSNKVIKDIVKEASIQTLAIQKTETLFQGEEINAVPISVARAGKESQGVQSSLDGAAECKRTQENKRVTRSTFLGSQITNLGNSVASAQDKIKRYKTPKKGNGITTTQERGDQILDAENTRHSSNLNGECNEDSSKGSKVTKKSVRVEISATRPSKVLGGLSKKRKRENGQHTTGKLQDEVSMRRYLPRLCKN